MIDVRFKIEVELRGIEIEVDSIKDELMYIDESRLWSLLNSLESINDRLEDLSMGIL